jgi:hypothetical protein
MQTRDTSNATPEKPQARFVVQGDGSIVDIVAKRMWAAENSFSAGYSKGISWKQAQEYCTSFRVGGYDDWRLPTLEELKELYCALVFLLVKVRERRYWTLSHLEKYIWSRLEFPGKAYSYTFPAGANLCDRRRGIPIQIHQALWSSTRHPTMLCAASLYFQNGRIFYAPLRAILRTVLGAGPHGPAPENWFLP